MSTDKIRIFFAVPLPAEVKELLHLQTQKWHNEISFSKWTHPEDYHITLKFIGEASQEDSRRYDEIARQTAAGHEPFGLRLSGVGAFGRPGRPSVLWAGAAGALDALGRLEQQLTAGLAGAGVPRENRPFRPHITLARNFKSGASPDDALWRRLGSDLPEAPWTVDRYVLYRTHLGRKPMYEAIGEYPLHAAE
ncbi:RNA 2',3'-cyclic phosphodiesterase [Paenibacillus gansuensis]|uniref:RNA 2',3'-cyclic phosphodiesterase n=1 Tax=Paenibacillus gansuensis TaxID=306542 RepID=A0ABW5PEQ8_9BACL